MEHAAYMINQEWVQHRSGEHRMFASSNVVKDWKEMFWLLVCDIAPTETDLDAGESG